MIKYGIPILISAPSGAGKTSLVAALAQKVDRVKVSISHTTRTIRPGEKDGEDYHFISRKTFEEKISAGDFLEYAQVFDNYYGTSRSWLETQLKQGYDVILEIDWQGAAQVRKIFPQSISAFIFPPSLEILEQRLHLRAQDDHATIRGRMHQAQDEMTHYKEYDYLIVNDTFQHALTELTAVIIAARQNVIRLQQDQSEWIAKMLKGHIALPPNKC